MSEEAIMPGPCVLCGDVDYPLSFGGPAVCPPCDCGSFHDESRALKRLLGHLPPATTNERRDAQEKKASFEP